MNTDPRLRAYFQKVAPPGSDLYYALLFAGDARQTISALHALAAEIAACSQQPSEADPGRIKLQWWSEEISRFAGDEQRHPLMAALAGEARELLGIAPLQAMVRNAAAVMSQAPPESPQEIVAHYRQQAAPLYESIAAIAGTTAPNAAALGGAIILVDEARVLCTRHTRFKSSAGDFDVTTLIDTAARELESARSAIGSTERAPLRTALIQAELAQRWLGKAVRLGSYDAPPLTPISKLWAAWRTARANV